MTPTTTIDGPTTIRIDRDAATFVMERTFAAPRPTVFRAWTTCESLQRWWGPTGWTLPVCDMDFRPGGTWFYGMQGPADDPEWANVIAYGPFTFQEIVEPVLLVALDQFADAQGQPMPDMPEPIVTVDFIDLDGRTKVITMSQTQDAIDRLRTALTGRVVVAGDADYDALRTVMPGASTSTRRPSASSAIRRTSCTWSTSPATPAWSSPSAVVGTAARATRPRRAASSSTCASWTTSTSMSTAARPGPARGSLRGRTRAPSASTDWRRGSAMVNLAAFYDDPDDHVRKQARLDAFATALRQGPPAAYVNFIGDEGAARVHDAYPGATWDRLSAIKQRYDPTNLFRRNQNVPPA